MTNAKELLKVREGFMRVKEDIVQLDTTKAEKSVVTELIREIEKLKVQVAGLQNENTKSVSSSNDEEIEYVGNNESKKIHRSNCPYAKKISKDHLVVFDSLKEGLKKGYGRCSCIGE